MINISRESQINLINILIDQDIISGKDLANIKKVSTEKQKSQLDGNKNNWFPLSNSSLDNPELSQPNKNPQ